MCITILFVNYTSTKLKKWIKNEIILKKKNFDNEKTTDQSF